MGSRYVLQKVKVRLMCEVRPSGEDFRAKMTQEHSKV